jgi:hypothetical protein
MPVTPSVRISRHSHHCGATTALQPSRQIRRQLRDIRSPFRNADIL